MNANAPDIVKRLRTIWISDLHLGTSGSHAQELLDFLQHHDSDKIYLVGDIIDGWSLKNSWYWPQLHSDVLKELIRKAGKGSRIIMIPGNHDEFLRPYANMNIRLGNIELKRDDIHLTADGRRLLVTHGDQFDLTIRYAKWVTVLGCGAYIIIDKINRLLNYFRRKLRKPYWSLAAYIKHNLKGAVQFICDYERYLVNEAKRRHCDGVVCGHIHHPQIKLIGRFLYANDGDWVDNCTAIVEHRSGYLEIIDWRDERLKLAVVRGQSTQKEEGYEDRDHIGCLASADKRCSTHT